MAGALNRKLFFLALEVNLYNFPIICRRDIFHVCGVTKKERYGFSKTNFERRTDAIARR